MFKAVDDILYYNDEVIFNKDRKFTYIVRIDSLAENWNKYIEDKEKFKSILFNKEELDKFSNDFLNKHIYKHKITDEKIILKYVLLSISFYALYCADKDKSCILNVIDKNLKRFPNIYAKINDLIIKYFIRYKEVFNKLEQHSITITVENELMDIYKDLFMSGLMESRYLGDEIGYGLINNILGRLFQISGSKKAVNDTSYRDINYDYISLKSNDLEDLLLNNYTLHKIKQFNKNNSITTIDYINPVFIHYIAIPFINEKTDYYLSLHNINNDIVYSIISQYFDQYPFLFNLYNTLGKINAPNIYIYDSLNTVKNSLCGFFYDYKGKIAYYNDIKNGLHKYGIRKITYLYPEIKQLQIEYSTVPGIIIQILMLLLYVWFNNKNVKDQVMYNYIKFIEVMWQV